MSEPEQSREPVLPVVRGDWVESCDTTYPRIARVVEAFWDVRGAERKCMVNLSIYSVEGERIGRVSPAMGGPSRFEPWIDYAGWIRIEKPRFPMQLTWVPEPESGDRIARYVSNAKRLGDRTVALRSRPLPGSGRVLPKPPTSDYDPELEIRSRRMAAQELRDINRANPVPALIERAEKLEAEASRLAREYGVEK